MGNSLRHCLACVLPCGALDLIRVVHLNGHVQEFSHPLTAGEILKANPGHVLTTPSSHANGLVRRVNILLPDSQLRRGGIHFLIPASDHRKSVKRSSSSSTSSGNGVFPDCKDDDLSLRMEDDVIVLKSKRTKPPSRRDRRSSRACTGAWRPHLQSISED